MCIRKKIKKISPDNSKIVKKTRPFDFFEPKKKKKSNPE